MNDDGVEIAVPVPEIRVTADGENDKVEKEETKDSFAKVTRKNVNTPKKDLQRRGQWKKNLNIVNGSAKDDNNDSGGFAADVSLVAYGVAKDASDEKLKGFLEKKGLNIVSVELMTTFNEARTHTYKVTIKASDFEKAKSPDIWPYRVGVRLFKHFSSRPRENNRKSGWEQQAGSSQQHQAGSSQQQQVVDPLVLQNKFSPLANLGESVTN